MDRMTLKAARVNAGYTMDEAAQKLCISRNTLWNWEHGKSFPDVRDAVKICDLYGKRYDDISFVPRLTES